MKVFTPRPERAYKLIKPFNTVFNKVCILNDSSPYIIKKNDLTYEILIPEGSIIVFRAYKISNPNRRQGLMLARIVDSPVKKDLKSKHIYFRFNPLEESMDIEEAF